MRKIINVFVLLSILLFPITADAERLFIVRTIYLKPFGEPAPTDRFAELMKTVQNLYRSEMDRHGYGLKSFRLETDKWGNAVVHIVKGKHRITDYDEIHADEILKEVTDKFREPNNIYIIILGGLRQINDGSGTPRCHIHMNSPFTNDAHGGYIMIASECSSFGVLSIAQALGSGFDLSNHITDKPSLMGDGTARTGISTESLTFYQARWLNKHRYFNGVRFERIVGLHGGPFLHPIIEPLKIRVVHPFYVIEKDIVRIRFTCSRNNQLHQAQISGIGWAEFNASSDTAEIVVGKSYLSNFQKTLFLVMDIEGNIGKLEVNIAYMIANAIELKLMTWAFLKTLR
jgi:hypothetical protein